MKLALLIALSADKRSGQTLTPDLVPFDQALKEFKGMVESGVGAAPVVEMWSGGRVVKSARFKVVQGAEAVEAAKKADEEAEAAEAAKKAAEEAEAAEAAKKAAEEAEAAEAAKKAAGAKAK